jgi:type II secretory pathway component GspD/PulD (secretin)
VCTALLLLATPAFASVSVKRAAEKPRTIDVTVVDEPLSTVVRAIAAQTSRRVQLLVSDDPRISYTAKHIAPEAALRAVAEIAGAVLNVNRNQYWVQNAPEATVTLDVKDQDIRVILKDMQRQCRIKNLVIDPQVSGSGTFMFENLACKTAFNVVLRTLGLGYVDYGNSVMSVERRK